MKKIVLVFISSVITLGCFALNPVSLPTPSDSVFISQNCDPKFNYAPDRFVEIYNSSTENVDLTGWTVENIQGGAVKFVWSLSGFIASGEALLLGRDNQTDQTILPDYTASWSGTSWNGTDGDGSVLKNANGVVVDSAVQVGTTNKFSDKQMVRNPDIAVPSTTFDASEWTFSNVDNASDATPGTHLCDLPIVNAPNIENLQPASSSTFVVGEEFALSATVKIDNPASIDYVELVYGDVFNELLDTVFCLSRVDTFKASFVFESADTMYARMIAYGSNGETTSSSIIEVYGVCGDISVPVATAASGVSQTGITANWEASVDADTYILDLWTETGEEATVYASSDFVDGVSPFPADWTKSEKVNTTSEGYRGNGLKLGISSVSGVVTSPAFSANEDFKVIFYAKQYDEDEQTISVSYGTQSEDVTTLGSTWDKYEVAFTAENGENSVSFEAMRAYLDSVLIQSGGKEKSYVLINDTVDNTSKIISGLMDNTLYKYNVRAYSQYGCESNCSDEISVTTGGPTYINTPLTKVNIFTSMGAVRVICACATDVEIFEITGSKVVQQHGVLEASFKLKSGLYLVKVGDTVTKVALQ